MGFRGDTDSPRKGATMNNKVKKVITWSSAVNTAMMTIAMVASATTKRRDNILSFKWEGYKVIVNSAPLGFLANNSLIAMTEADVVNGVIKIQVDNLYLKAPKDVQKAVLMHELGHHLSEGGIPDDQFGYMSQRMLGICPSCEKAADAYAAKIVGKKAMRKFLVTFSWVNPVESVQRLIALR